MPWAFPTLSAWVYGRRLGELVTIGSGTGSGKSEFIFTQAASDLSSGYKVGLFMLESSAANTAKRLAGKLADKLLHVPTESGEVPEGLEDAWSDLRAYDDSVFLYDHRTSMDWDEISKSVRVMAAQGVSIFYLDNLTVMTQIGDERREIDRVLKGIIVLINELNIHITLVCHLRTPSSEAHEEGHRVMSNHFNGSRQISQMSSLQIGLERHNQHADDFCRSVTTLRILKDRFTGQANGKILLLGYDQGNGKQYELSKAEVERYNETKDSTNTGFVSEDF